MKLQTWFLGKLTDDQLRVATSNKSEVVAETEKALKLELVIVEESKILTIWIPKSVILTDEEVASEDFIEFIKEEVEPARAQMITVLKSAKIKGVTARSKNAILVKKIIENNLVNEIKGYDLVNGQYGQYFKLNEFFKEQTAVFCF